MPPPASREPSRTRSSSRNGSSSGGRSANVSRNISSDRVSLVQDFDRRADPAYRKSVRSIPSESEYDSNGSRSENDSHGRTKSGGRSRGSNGGNDTDGSMGSGNVTDRRKKMHSKSDSGNRSARDQSRGPRASSQASSTRSSRAESPAPVYLFNGDPYPSFAPESVNLSIYDGDEYHSDSGRKKHESKSRKTIRPPLAPFDGEEYLKGQLSDPQAKAKRATVGHVNIHAEGEVPILETCSDWEEGSKIKRKPIKKREQTRGPDIKRNAEESQPKHHGNGDKQSKPKSGSSSIDKPPGVKSKIDGKWYSIGGKKEMRTQIPPANTNRRSANEQPPGYGNKILKEWWEDQSHPDSTPKGLVNQPKSTPQRDYAKNRRDPGPEINKGRNHSQHSERHTSSDDLFDRLAGPPPQKNEKKKKKKRLLGEFFGSWRTQKGGLSRS
ncbi:hypothetical protein BHYA_0073g00030 [Botrytis hyacinthi]|uniref:Uncharacterized protein n=1 Tax=Botrytis hyacinthi TaxID=278943 RepID=A0A4Z1GNE9_9HELO|nr:hypothetical protein BHYA_0073g00030 [Botrytis hyacinthi]